MTDFATRSVRSDDRAAWEDLWAQYNAFYGREGETALSEGIVDSTWTRLLDQNEPVHCLVSESGRTLIGLAHFVFHRNLIQIENTCYMQDLFTLKAARGQGVARALIEAVGEACRKHGVLDIYWHTHASNATARALYDRLSRNTDFVVYRRPA